MKKIEYDIKYDEENNPYIHLYDGNMNIEDIFFCFEMTKYRIFGILNDSKNDFLPKEALNELALSGNIINDLSIKLGEMVKGSNDSLKDANDLLNNLPPMNDSEDNSKHFED